MTVEERIQALDEKYKQHITGLNLQIASIMTQYSALSMQYALLLTRVDILEHPDARELQSTSDVLESVTVPPTPHTAERSRVMNTPPPFPKLEE